MSPTDGDDKIMRLRNINTTIDLTQATPVAQYGLVGSVVSCVFVSSKKSLFILYLYYYVTW